MKSNSIDDRKDPFNDQTIQAVFLFEMEVQKLFESESRLTGLLALPIVDDLGLEYLIDQLFEDLEGHGDETTQ